MLALAIHSPCGTATRMRDAQAVLSISDGRLEHGKPNSFPRRELYALEQDRSASIGVPPLKTRQRLVQDQLEMRNSRGFLRKLRDQRSRHPLH